MTTLQEAQELLKQLPEEDVRQIVQLMKTRLDNAQRKSRNGEELFREMMALREITLNYQFEDIDTARDAVLTEKYGKY